MLEQAPPGAPPKVQWADDDGLGRLRFRLWQLMMTALTVLVTAWFCTFGAIPAIVSVLAAKHVLVAILCAGLHWPETGVKPPG